MAFKEEEERDLPSFNQRIVMGGSPLMTEHRILARDPSSRDFEKEKGSITGGDEEGDEESTRWGSIHNKITGIIILDLRRNEGIQLRANRQTITKDRQRKTDTERQWRWDTKGWHWQEKCQEEKREKLSEKKERTRHRLYSLFSGERETRMRKTGMKKREARDDGNKKRLRSLQWMQCLWIPSLSCFSSWTTRRKSRRAKEWEEGMSYKIHRHMRLEGKRVRKGRNLLKEDCWKNSMDERRGEHELGNSMQDRTSRRNLNCKQCTRIREKDCYSCVTRKEWTGNSSCWRAMRKDERKRQRRVKKRDEGDKSSLSLSLYKHWCLRDTHLSPLHSRGCRFSCIKMLIFKGDEMTTERQSHGTTDTVCSVNRKSKNIEICMFEKRTWRKEDVVFSFMVGNKHIFILMHTNEMMIWIAKQAHQLYQQRRDMMRRRRYIAGGFTTYNIRRRDTSQETRRREGCVSNNSKDKTMEN